MERYGDEELLYLMRCGSQIAECLLYRSYYRQVRKWIEYLCGYNVADYDIDDYVQFAMMTFYKIIDNYRNDQNASFRTFMKQSILRRVAAYIKIINEQKRFIDLTIVSFDDYVGEDKTRLEEMVDDPNDRYSPDKLMAVKEMKIYYMVKLGEETSDLEQNSIMLLNAGYTHEEISKKLDVSLKSVYNAIYRYHQKALAIDEEDEMC